MTDEGDSIDELEQGVKKQGKFIRRLVLITLTIARTLAFMALASSALFLLSMVLPAFGVAMVAAVVSMTNTLGLIALTGILTSGGMLPALLLASAVIGSLIGVTISVVADLRLRVEKRATFKAPSFLPLNDKKGTRDDTSILQGSANHNNKGENPSLPAPSEKVTKKSEHTVDPYKEESSYFLRIKPANLSYVNEKRETVSATLETLPLAVFQKKWPEMKSGYVCYHDTTVYFSGRGSLWQKKSLFIYYVQIENTKLSVTKLHHSQDQLEELSNVFPMDSGNDKKKYYDKPVRATSDQLNLLADKLGLPKTTQSQSMDQSSEDIELDTIKVH